MRERTRRTDDGGFHAITREAWREFKTASDYSTGMGEVTRGTSHPPGGFVQEELGFGTCMGPSMLFVFQTRAHADQAHLRVALRTEKSAGARAIERLRTGYAQRKRKSAADYARLLRRAVGVAERELAVAA
jgi:hypothetical protein